MILALPVSISPRFAAVDREGDSLKNGGESMRLARSHEVERAMLPHKLPSSGRIYK
jgi:hypothetical protein